jgi:hypothetical protein
MKPWLVTQINDQNITREREIVAPTRARAGSAVDHAAWSEGWKILDIRPVPPKALPEMTKATCDECPWRRNSAPGWLGPLSAEDWVRLAHSDEPIACHKTIVADDEWETGHVYQCAGAAVYRKNVCKLPPPGVALAEAPDRENVFSNPMEFREHHGEKIGAAKPRGDGE